MQLFIGAPASSLSDWAPWRNCLSYDSDLSHNYGCNDPCYRMILRQGSKFASNPTDC